MPENGRFLDEAPRVAALRALEDEFAATLTEAQVFQAARLFLSLVSSAAVGLRLRLTQPTGYLNRLFSQVTNFWLRAPSTFKSRARMARPMRRGSSLAANQA